MKLRNKFSNISKIRETSKLNWSSKPFRKWKTSATSISSRDRINLFCTRSDWKLMISSTLNSTPIKSKSGSWNQKNKNNITICSSLLSIKMKVNCLHICCFFRVFVNFLIPNIVCSPMLEWNPMKMQCIWCGNILNWTPNVVECVGTWIWRYKMLQMTLDIVKMATRKIKWDA